MAQDNDPHGVIQNAYMQMVKTMDQLTQNLTMDPKDRIAIVLQVFRAYAHYLHTQETDSDAKAGSTADQFKSAFKSPQDGAAGRGTDGRPADPDDESDSIDAQLSAPYSD